MNGARYTTKELLARLVGFDTTSQFSNLPLVDFVRDYLASHGVAATLVADETGEKAALFATIGANVEGGVVLSGHTDTVPVTGQPWTSDPFTLVERDGRLYGRGSTDMKGFDASVLALVPELLAAGLARPIHIALSYDEEVGCLGVRPLAQAMVEAVARPAAVIVGEPTGMRPVDAHKSAHVFETVVTGREAHSSAPERGVNAIIYAGRFIGEIERIGERLRIAGDPSGRFDPPCTTVGVGVIEGGTAHNIVPRQCRVTWGLRGLPETDIDEIADAARHFACSTLEAEMQATAAEASVVTTAKTSILPLKPEPGSSADRLIRRLSDIDTMGAVSYGTDAGFFQLHGWPAVVCGPGHIAQAHRPDEFIEESELAACEAFVRRLAGELAGAGSA